ncbi:MAG TPA: hypothetical protein VK541_15980 [Pedobacter sp.]|nr:hypothetical protein [Pedobacter sp.]HMI03986.1 hypothetical protein [Pedobacter sp.]
MQANSKGTASTMFCCKLGISSKMARLDIPLHSTPRFRYKTLRI